VKTDIRLYYYQLRYSLSKNTKMQKVGQYIWSPKFQKVGILSLYIGNVERPSCCDSSEGLNSRLLKGWHVKLHTVA